ncbi:MAG: flagellar hook-associated protein FlgK [Planctomycetaceae bacterium]|jgi:flagellar hook-associated protein 1 FlgK|nr:flagellar hook-associated protein FlgK [Planctomycetaceae bacterium]
MLFSSLQMAGTSLNASTVGIQVAGQNLSNVNTPGYIRERLLLETASPYNQKNLTLGNGVQVGGVAQIIDTFLEERLRNSLSDANSSAQQSDAYTQLETLLGELSTNDISTSLTSFFNAIDNVLNQPENLSYRQMVAGEGEALAEKINNAAQAILQMQIDLNKQVETVASQINELTAQIQSLNVEIARVEAGNNSGNQAVGLRDQRYAALTELSQLINIRTHENEHGVVSVFCGSDPLIVEGTRREAVVRYENDNDSTLNLATVCIEPSQNKLDVSAGRLFGMYQGRDEILGGFAKQLDQYAHSLITEFNKIFTSGQGLTGYDSLTSIEAVGSADAPLNAAGLTETPVNGAFQILVNNKTTGKTTICDIPVSLTSSQKINDPFGVGDPIPATGTTLRELADALNAVNGIRATVANDNRLQISAESDEIEFSFAQDSSGILASLGINSFFTGSDATTIGVNSVMKNDPSKFAASKNGIAADTKNGELLANMPEKSLQSLNNQSIALYFRNIYDSAVQKAGTIKAMAAGDAAYYAALESQKQAISGVNIDEETLLLLTFQRAYQASARYVTTINDMLEVLLTM